MKLSENCQVIAREMDDAELAFAIGQVGTQVARLESTNDTLLEALKDISKKDFDVSEYATFVYTTATKAIREAEALKWTVVREE